MEVRSVKLSILRAGIYSRAMAHILVIGASKGIGLETVRRALEAGHSVRALARSANGIGLADPRLEEVRGDALKTVDVAAALKGVSVVIQTLGIRISEMLGARTASGRVQLCAGATRVLHLARSANGMRTCGSRRERSQASISLRCSISEIPPQYGTNRVTALG